MLHVVFSVAYTHFPKSFSLSSYSTLSSSVWNALLYRLFILITTAWTQFIYVFNMSTAAASACLVLLRLRATFAAIKVRLMRGQTTRLLLLLLLLLLLSSSTQLNSAQFSSVGKFWMPSMGQLQLCLFVVSYGHVALFAQQRAT